MPKTATATRVILADSSLLSDGPDSGALTVCSKYDIPVPMRILSLGRASQFAIVQIGGWKDDAVLMQTALHRRALHANETLLSFCVPRISRRNISSSPESRFILLGGRRNITRRSAVLISHRSVPGHAKRKKARGLTDSRCKYSNTANSTDILRKFSVTCVAAFCIGLALAERGRTSQ